MWSCHYFSRDLIHTCSLHQVVSGEGICDLFIILPDESANGFQCYDGTWIPMSAFCDRHRDCAGKIWEDEPAGCCKRDNQIFQIVCILTNYFVY